MRRALSSNILEVVYVDSWIWILIFVAIVFILALVIPADPALVSRLAKDGVNSSIGL